MSGLTREQVVSLLSAVAAAVAEAGTAGIPSGHLYARVMGSLSLSAYEALIGSLVEVGLVEVRSHVLYPTAQSLKLLSQ